MSRIGALVSIICVAYAVPALGQSTKQPPTKDDLVQVLESAMPPYWSIDSIQIRAEVNKGDEVNPRYKQRFEAEATPKETLYAKSNNKDNPYSPFVGLLPTIETDASRTLYGVATSTYEAGNWSTNVALENHVKNIGKPKSYYSSPTVVIGSNKQAEIIELLKTERSQRLRENLDDIEAEIRDKHEKQLEELRQTYREKMQKIRERFEKKINNVEQEYAAILDNVSAEKVELIETRENEIAKLRQKYLSTKRDLEQKIEQLKVNHEQKVAHLKNNHDNKIEQLKESHEKEIQEIKTQHQQELDKVKLDLKRADELNKRLKQYDERIKKLKETQDALVRKKQQLVENVVNSAPNLNAEVWKGVWNGVTEVETENGMRTITLTLDIKTTELNNRHNRLHLKGDQNYNPRIKLVGVKGATAIFQVEGNKGEFVKLKAGEDGNVHGTYIYREDNTSWTFDPMLKEKQE